MNATPQKKAEDLHSSLKKNLSQGINPILYTTYSRFINCSRDKGFRRVPREIYR